ncbi:hypothetical protein GCM10025857_24390 [Alicyclobacillus contaminans]|uniref:GGDEF domain-containing protein n=1 Tax=Alicyclobacillus contaminans TaxID=392016 RepID=UPI000427F6A9|nr:GGDEF domain-containing protein [Alicyclobacillus contaminans]GMA51082.1 hypothetical protein GCM10025857_24390 [Alicyclobacillus contaminans]
MKLTSDLRVVLLTALCCVFSDAFLIPDHLYAQAVVLGASVLFVVVALLLPSQRLWLRTALLTLSAVAIAGCTLAYPSYVLYTLVMSAVISSFLSVRLRAIHGLIYFLLQLAVSAWPLYRMLRHPDAAFAVIVVSACVVLIAQIAEVSVKFHQYRRLSIFDELTGLHNVRYFRYKMQQYLKHPKVQHLCLLLVDLDKFKVVNDTYGHREGDEVLKRAAQLLQQHANPAVISRYGGEEFAIILPNAAESDAVRLAERLRSALQSAVLCAVPVTLSCGIVYSDAKDVDVDALFDAADAALYEAKQTRNCVCVRHLKDGARPVPGKSEWIASK